ncbi:FG-GAP repeat domain-containing protein, partial [Planktothrix mougeotii]
MTSSFNFTENTNVSLIAFIYGGVATADFDKDDNTDILLTGLSIEGYAVSPIYINNGSGDFSFNTNASFFPPSVNRGSVVTADFDSDGDTDILLTGYDSSPNFISQIYSNNGSGDFSENTDVSLPSIVFSSVATADFDKDGDVDILLTGLGASAIISQIYTNNGSEGFSQNTNVSLPGVFTSSVATADFDNDGDTDILLTGFDGSTAISQIYTNNGSGGFSQNTNVSLPMFLTGSVTTVDFDKDGDTDILITGIGDNGPMSQIYTNNGSGGFSQNTNVSLPGVYFSSVATADFDKDGDIDILLTGNDSSIDLVNPYAMSTISKIYTNNGSGGFSENTNVSLTGVFKSSVATADFDKDGYTDILLMGYDISKNIIVQVYTNA